MSLSKFFLWLMVGSLLACSNPQAKITGEQQSQSKASEPTLTEVKPEKIAGKVENPAHNKPATELVMAKDKPTDLGETNTSYDKKGTLSNEVTPTKKVKVKSGSTPVPSSVKVAQEQPTKVDISKEVEKSKVVESAPPPAPKVETVSHEAWNKLLQQFVSATGKVNYQGIKAQMGGFNAYLEELAKNPPQSSWSRNEQMAYWINAYNAFTIKLIVDNYPVKSITDLHGGKPWDRSWIKLGDKTYSLNQIENDILRPKYKDARIHFAVNCAAKSCPPLLNKAWTADNLNANLNSQAKKFINNSSFNKISASEVTISKIFDWYAVDFGNLIDYLNTYATTKINADAKVNYKEYDWALNN